MSDYRERRRCETTGCVNTEERLSKAREGGSSAGSPVGGA